LGFLGFFSFDLQFFELQFQVVGKLVSRLLPFCNLQTVGRGAVGADAASRILGWRTAVAWKKLRENKTN